MQNALAERVAPAARPAPANALAGLYFDPRYEAVASNPTPQFDTTMAGARDYAMNPRSVGNQIVMNMATSAAPVDVRGGARAVQGIRAYHGSPHRFDRFDMSRIGTGEGAQAYGHGLYFAENEGVARSYRDALAPGITWRELSADADEWIRRAVSETPGIQVDDVLEYARGLRDPWDSAAAGNVIAEEIEQAIRSGRVQGGTSGSMYEVNLRVSPDRLLDWDAPLSQQPAPVRDALGRLVDPAWTAGETGARMQGGPLYRTIAQTPEAQTQALRDAGVQGIRYLDQGSRGAGQGTRNYVIFNDDLIDILRRYGLLGMLGGGAAAAGAGGGEG